MMALDIETFSSSRGGNSFYKAVTHPRAAAAAAALVRRLAAARRLAVCDPLGFAAGFAAIHGGIAPAGVFVQDLEAVGRQLLGGRARAVIELPELAPDLVLVAAFDAARLVEQIRYLVPAGAEIVTLDAMRIPDALLTNTRNYLDPLNFATNFAFFRDADGLHTRLVTANYWPKYGGGATVLELTLFGGDGAVLAEWREESGDGGAAIVLDSREIRTRFGLPAFTGQLFLHVVGAAGHDIVKYALDTFGDVAIKGGADEALSCTHDANSWPADRYAGLPAPAEGERVVLWLQNSHPCHIPAGAVGLNMMGRDDVRSVSGTIPPFASLPLEVAELFPEARWPEQLELRAGKHFVRPRYEIIGQRARRIAHVNVERGDLAPDPRLAELSALGKGFLLPAPILPVERWRTLALPTPMATSQEILPVAAVLYDRGGAEVARHRFGALKRAQSVALDIDSLLREVTLPGGFGHLELVYDFAAAAKAADGWLHAIFRYEARAGGHAAETSFGAHIFNTVVTYKSEPQSYAGRPPGLSTGLFLRLGQGGDDTLCHLIYPASAPWRPASSTELILHRRDGSEASRRRVEIPCSGSLFWRYHEMFDGPTRAAAGQDAYIIIRDTTCRLFGYHGLVGGGGAFSLDHMFGF